MKKIKQKINDIRLQNKLVIIYVVTGLIPLIVLFVFAYCQMRNILMDRDLKSIKGAIEQSVATVDGQIEVYDNLSNYITFNDTLSGVLSYDYKSTYEMYNQIVTTFDPMLSSLKYFHNDINRVTIYVDKAIKHDTTIAPIEEIKDRPFYNSAAESTKIQWFVDEDSRTLVSARKMSTLDQLGILGIMYIDVDYDSMMSSFTGGLEQNCGMVVLDADGKVICSSDTFENNNTRYRLNSKKLLSLIDGAEWDNDTCGNTEGYSVVKKESSVTGWTVYVYEPRKLVLRSANSMITMIVVAFVVAVAGAAAASIFTTGFITRRINKLKNSMAKVENGDFDAVINTQDKDEIGDLIHSFNSMTTQIKNLITQVYEGRISQKESEMRALRAQINPHFLYNTLESITWMVEAKKNLDAVFMISELAKLLRISLSKGRTVIRISDEIQHSRSYMNIQKVRYKERFQIEFDIDEEINEYCTVKLIVQPILENAIYYGVGNMDEDDGGKITIRGEKKDDDIYISVEDNGMGMNEDIVENILKDNNKVPKHGSGVGLINVHSRIQLMFGNEYGLEVYSEPDEGTRIVIHIPAIPYTEENREQLETQNYGKGRVTDEEK